MQVIKGETGAAQGFKKVHGEPFGRGLLGETDPAKTNRLVAQHEVAGPFGVVDQGMCPHGGGAKAKAVPGRGAGKDERCAFQEGGKDGLQVGGNVPESARSGNGEQSLPQLLKAPFPDEPLREPDGVGRPCGQGLGSQHLAGSQFGGGGSSHCIKYPVKTIRSDCHSRKGQNGDMGSRFLPNCLYFAHFETGSVRNPCVKLH